MNRQKITCIRDLIALIGGLTVVSRKLGHRHCTTVQRWCERNSLPPWRRPEIAALLAEEGIRLTRKEEKSIFVSKGDQP